MGKLIEFPSQNRPDEQETPDYTGHVMILNLEKARRFQCFNFIVVANSRIAIVPETTDMRRIHAAIESGILTDVTEHPELLQAEKPIAEVNENDTGKRCYSETRAFFQRIGIGDDFDVKHAEETVVYSTDDPDEQTRIEEALAARPAPTQPARPRRALIELPPGMDNPERYLLPGSKS